MNSLKTWFATSPFSKIASMFSLSFVFVAIANAAGSTPTTPPAPVTNGDQLLQVICTFLSYFFWLVASSIWAMV